MLTSQVTLLRGKKGLRLNTPCRNLRTKGCLPLGKLSQTIKVDKAERAVFKALYPIPVENNNVSKLRSSLKHGENGLMFLSQQ